MSSEVGPQNVNEKQLFNDYQSEVDYLHIKFYFVFYSYVACCLVLLLLITGTESRTSIQLEYSFKMH